MAGVVLGAGAAGSVGAGAAVGLSEGGPDDRQAVAAAGGLPVPTDLARGADHVAGVVVDPEAGQVERVVVAGLPAGVGWQRAGQLDAMVVGRRKDLPDIEGGVDLLG